MFSSQRETSNGEPASKLTHQRQAADTSASTGDDDSPVASANRFASVDLPPPALPNTATFLM
jgi:hypothetical protein